MSGDYDDDASSSSSSSSSPPSAGGGGGVQQYDDEPRDMTYGRRLARSLSRFGWYNPHGRARKAHEISESLRASGHSVALPEAAAGGDGGDAVVEAAEEPPPSLDAAWAYFEHVILPRHFAHHGGGEAGDADGLDTTSRTRRKAVKRRERALAFEERTTLWGRTFGQQRSIDLLLRAKPGETEERTALYSVLRTPESELADFGVGVGLYFTSLRVLGLIMLVAGLINVPILLYFSSGRYAGDGQSSISQWYLTGSAICTTTRWRACPTCSRGQWDDSFPATFDRYATATRSGEVLHFILDNECDITGGGGRVGLFAFVSLVWVCVTVYAMGLYSGRKEVQYDEMQQTATDYSIEVEDPPEDANDPEEWRDFFQQFGGHVTVCTVALDNEDLVRVLERRRGLLLQLETMLPPGFNLDPSNLEDCLADVLPLPFWRRLLCAASAEGICQRILALDEEIEVMSLKKYDVSNVFVTYETEEDQRRALKKLSVKKLDVWTNNVPTERLFRGEHVLSVKEPPEPDSVRWDDLDETFMHKIIVWMVTTTMIIAAIVGGAVCIALARRRDAFTAGIVIKVLNAVTPYAVTLITNLESHSSEGSKETSQYFKMTFFRWCNTAIVTTIITPFTDTLQDGNGHLINSVFAIFVIEMVVGPILQVGDIMGNLNRHILGPRARDQRQMNLKFSGGAWQLSERYTDMTKILFLCFFYSIVFPAGFFFTAVTLFVVYWTDKFVLLRSWAPAPRVGTEISSFSRNYFFTLTLVVYAIMVSYGYASFPYDNACEEDGTQVTDAYVGRHNATSADPTTGDPIEVSIRIDPADSNFFFCSQDLIRYMPPAFPALPKYQPAGAEWMTTEQEEWSRILGWASVAIIGFVVLVFVNRIFVYILRSIFSKSYRGSGRAMEDRFSEVEEIHGYVPQVRIAGHPFPKLLCYVDDIHKGLVGWTDPNDLTYDAHNLIFDVPRVAKAVEERRSMRSSTDERHVTDSCLFSIVKHWPPSRSQA